MSKMLELTLRHELDRCRKSTDIDAVSQKYRMAFSNAVDASDFNKMLKSRREELIH